jgi:DNA-binding IclR family transcriptional regulator
LAIDNRHARDEVLQRGWATDEGEYETFPNCVAAPVWGPPGEVAGAISITAFREMADIAALKGLVPTLLTTTTAISNDLGWR